MAGSALVACQSVPKRIFYINSYHPGYPASDETLRGLGENLDSRLFDLDTFFLDTKRRPDSASVAQRVSLCLAHLRSFDPDLVVVSDDDAVKYVVVPHLSGTSLPVIFCGVNWSAQSYGLSSKNVTGMLEVLPLESSLTLFSRALPWANRLAVISENSNSERRNTELLDTLYRRMGWLPSYYLVDTFDEWKAALLASQDSAELLYLPTNGALWLGCHCCPGLGT
ncbi:MAG: hypothetical protein HC842_00160 [Cytophagales bacterium]|nr:hypothetical protein [Cytophagales bacterium]